MKEPRIKAPDEPPMKLAEPPVIDGVVEAEIVHDPLAWQTMDNAPKDGTILEMKVDPDDAQSFNAKWYRTRIRDPRAHRWVETGWWVDPITRLRIQVEPFCWRMREGFLPPGMIAA